MVWDRIIPTKNVKFGQGTSIVWVLIQSHDHPVVPGEWSKSGRGRGGHGTRSKVTHTTSVGRTVGPIHRTETESVVALTGSADL